jgi:mono/diheme cytochrome c family protein
MAAPASAQSKSGKEELTQDHFKNIKVLKDIPVSELEATMRLFTTSLGVNCSFCHVLRPGAPPQFDSDDKDTKKKARDMIKMVRDINQHDFEGKMEVSCATCHRGNPKPLHVAEPLTAAAVLPPDPKDLPQNPPTAASLLDRYAEAIGGSAAAQKITTRVIKGVLAGADGRETEVEIREKAPDMYMEVIRTRNGSRASGFGSGKAWIQDQNGKHEVLGLNADALARMAQFNQDFHLRDELADTSVGRKDWGPMMKIGDKNAYLVNGMLRDGTREQLFFDPQTGLLLRRLDMVATPVGLLPEQLDYDDYREVDGVKLPFVIRRYDHNQIITLKIATITQNVELADKDFELTQQAAK